MTEKGKKIMNMLKYIETFHKQIAQIIRKCEDGMNERGWKSIKKDSAVVGTTSKDFKWPDYWIPKMIFRIYSNAQEKNIVRGLAIDYDLDPECELNEPILILGKILYKQGAHRSIDDLDKLWFDEIKKGKRSPDGNIHILKDLTNQKLQQRIVEAKLFALNLVEIEDENAIEKKIIEGLMKL